MYTSTADVTCLINTTSAAATGCTRAPGQVCTQAYGFKGTHLASVTCKFVCVHRVLAQIKLHFICYCFIFMQH